MDLKLPLMVARHGGRLVTCWLPHWPHVRGEGISLSELKDDLALMVMQEFVLTPPAEAWRYQMAPHLKLRHVAIDTIAHDRADGRSYTLKGTVSVLLEKWPADDFWLARLTRAPTVCVALKSQADLEAALKPALESWCLKHEVETLEPFQVEHDERLDVLEVDADAPTVLPPGARRVPTRKKKSAAKASAAPVEVEEDREQRRARARLGVRTLREIAKNLTHQARDGVLTRAVGREDAVQALVEALEQREGNAIVLVGEPGVGKTAIIHEATRRLAARQAASSSRRDVWRTDGNQFIAGMMYVGQWEARARSLCAELVDTGDVLFIDDLASFIFAGRHAKGDTHAAQYLEPHLARGEITVIAECTPARFERIREEAPSFAALFDVVQVGAMTSRQTLPVLLSTVRGLEDEQGQVSPRVPPDVLELVLELSERFFAHQALPGRAVHLTDRVLGGPGLVEGSTRRYRTEDVYDAVRRQTGLPDFILGGAPPKRREQMVRELSAQVAGQPDAIDAVADAVLALQASVQDPDKPLANLLFVGPTGVGKTETAKALARYLFGSSDRLVRFDMSELASPASIARLVGQVGGPDGELVTALRTQPFCVVLFDEIEKAHPRVFDALLQFLGEGRLTDAAGHTANGRNCVVIMTSNLGVREAASQAGFARQQADTAAQHYLSAARAFFRPELFNRLDRVVPFRSLDKGALRRVVEHALAELLSRRGLRRSNVMVDVEPELLELLVEHAYDPRFGARPLKRLLEKKLALPLAHHLLQPGDEQLVLIELLRQGDEPRLSVRVLSLAQRVLVGTRQWLPSFYELSMLIASTHDTVVELLATPRAERLRGLRDAALARRAEVPQVCDLVDRLHALDARLSPMLAELEPSPFAEHFSEDSRVRWDDSMRPRIDEKSVEYVENREAYCAANAPVVFRVYDELKLVEAQLANSEAPDEVVALLVSPVGASPVDAVRAFVDTLPDLGGRLLLETAEGWKWDVAAGPVRRCAVVLRGPGVRAQVEPWCGHGRASFEGADGLPTRTLVRAVPLAGGDGSLESVRALLDAHDRALLAEREVRRAGGPDPVDPYPRLVLEDGRFVATGLPASEGLQHLSACLRTSKEEER